MLFAQISTTRYATALNSFLLAASLSCSLHCVARVVLRPDTRAVWIQYARLGNGNQICAADHLVLADRKRETALFHSRQQRRLRAFSVCDELIPPKADVSCVT